MEDGADAASIGAASTAAPEEGHCLGPVLEASCVAIGMDPDHFAHVLHTLKAKKKAPSSDDEDGGLEGEDEVTPLFSELSIAQQNARHKHCLLTTLAHSPFYVIFQSTSKVIFYFCSMGHERTCASVQTLHS